ncbi:type II secretion system protein GspC [Mangrovimicrobium sediminis]|uniref:Type II secretion system protein GspC n=1 Tax=Mangrovimicrobium sediminis TaxID=2562682 RepID=A0A4Z0M4Q9_9GAMM|nr:type II secretion system protein GspC [Haliea sp. SAOS-164]
MQASAHYLSQPPRLRRLRQLLLALLCLWLVLSLARLFWAFFPVPEPEAEPPVAIINPATRAAAGGERSSVDIEALRAQHLFGEAAAAEAVVVPEPEVPVASDREGIEEGARETRLQLTLRGIVAASEDGLGHAIIEHRNQQEVYAVEDKLPVGNNVTLAKVMPRQVVLDNNGTYELLTLFEETDLDKQAEQAARAPAQRLRPRLPDQSASVVDKRAEASTTELARGYRDQLYENPQSLAQVVRVSAVREDGRLVGYRIAPGQDAAQFESLGFKPGDVVTSVNGITLDDPAGAMRLYQTMRTASEAVFELQRGGELISVNVSLGASGG